MVQSTPHGVFSASRLFLAGTVLVALVAACGGATASPGASGNKPTVLLQTPTNGAVVAVGQDVTVAGTASDTVGVDHVALFADGVSFGSTPAGQPAPVVPFSLTWLATPAGPHVLQVIAYRADGTPSDPAIANIVVGAGGSGGLGTLTPFSFPVASSGGGGGGGLITPKPTKKPKPTPAPTTEPTAPSSTVPTDTPTLPPTPTPSRTPVPTAAADGTAPDDTASEPHMIVLDPANAAQCPLDSSAIPMAAIGCVWEQVSAPSGDTTDQLAFVPVANTAFKVEMTSCSDTSDVTEWFSPPKDQNTLLTGCIDWLTFAYGPTAGATQAIQVDLGTPATQTYNLYQFTVYQCQFAGCGTQ